jgi:hypothetical protein
MSNINIDILIEKIISLKHEENPENQSVEFQAFVNGWNNALGELIKELNSPDGEKS